MLLLDGDGVVFSSDTLRKTYVFIPKLRCLEANRSVLFIISHGLNLIV